MEITGKMTLNGRETEFTLFTRQDLRYSQWGASTPTLGERVDLLQGLHEALVEWAQDNLCSECEEATLDDGEGYDGKCGDCADRAEKEK